MPVPTVGPGSPGFVDRAPLLDPEELRSQVESRFNPTLLVHGERGSGKTVATRLSLHAQTSVVHVKLWAQDLDSPLKAMSRAIMEAAGVDPQPGTATLVTEAALRQLKGSGWGIGGKRAPIVVIELDKRCTAAQLQAVLLTCKRWGDDESLAKFVVEAPSARIARGLTISLSDLRVEGVKVRIDIVYVEHYDCAKEMKHRGAAPTNAPFIRRGRVANIRYTVGVSTTERSLGDILRRRYHIPQ